MSRKTHTHKSRVGIAAIAVAIVAAVAAPIFWAAESGAPMMYLTTKDFESGISYRDVQYHSPLGMVVNPCSYADKLEPTLDWNDGKGPHKPDTNTVTKILKNTSEVPIIVNGVYLFWDDAHVAPAAGESVVTTKLVVHCLGDPPGDRTYTTKNTIHTYARPAVKSVEFEKGGTAVTTVKGHELVDVRIVLEGAAPASGTWVKLTTTPQAALNSLAPFYYVVAGEDAVVIRGLETRRPATDTSLVVTAVTVGEGRRTGGLVVTP